VPFRSSKLIDPLAAGAPSEQEVGAWAAHPCGPEGTDPVAVAPIPDGLSPEFSSPVSLIPADSIQAEPLLCHHCGRTASNGISCEGACVADSGY